MSPKDHKHPEWEAQWRDTMADHQSAPATDEDWSAMSALLDGGGAAPADPQPNPTVGGGVSAKLLTWLVPMLATTGLVATFWLFSGAEKWVPTEVLGLAEKKVKVEDPAGREVDTTTTGKASSVVPPSGRDEMTVSSAEAGFAGGQSRRATGKNLASRVRAQNAPEPTVEDSGTGGGPAVPGRKKTSDPSPTLPTEEVPAGASTAEEPVVPSPITSADRRDAETESPEVTARRPFRRIPRRMPMLLRSFDPDALWQQKINRQIRALRPRPGRPTKADNGLYPRVKTRY